MADLARGAGLPVPEITDEGGAVIVRFRPSRYVAATGLSVSKPAERRDAILGFLDGADNGLSRREIHALLGPSVSERQVRRELTALSNRWLIASTGHGPLTRWLRVSGSDRGQTQGRHRSDSGHIQTTQTLTLTELDITEASTAQFPMVRHAAETGGSRSSRMMRR